MNLSRRYRFGYVTATTMKCSRTRGIWNCQKATSKHHLILKINPSFLLVLFLWMYFLIRCKEKFLNVITVHGHFQLIVSVNVFECQILNIQTLFHNCVLYIMFSCVLKCRPAVCHIIFTLLQETSLVLCKLPACRAGKKVQVWAVYVHFHV